MLIKYPLVPFAICLIHLQLLLQDSFHQEEVKQPHCRNTQRPKIMNFLGLLRHQITCHQPPFPVCQNGATTVARTSLTKTVCLSTCWWSMEPAISKKYCKTDICLRFRHTKGSALSYATLSSRHYLHLLATGPAGVEGRLVREIMLSLDGISVGGQSTREREGSAL